MIVVRQVLKAKYGKAGDVVNVMRETKDIFGSLKGPRAWRVLTDLSGPFDTVVLEMEIESLAAWDELRGRMFGDPNLQQIFSQIIPLLDGGSGELYTLEVSG